MVSFNFSVTIQSGDQLRTAPQVFQAQYRALAGLKKAQKAKQT